MAVSARAFARLHRHWVSVLWIAIALLASVAQAATYVYDANGRLRAVTSSTGESSQYTYDALGNILAVDHIAAGQLSIAAFIPNHGPAGSTVTIYGQGFSTTPSNNTVRFNGITGVVTSAAANQLVATVPATATTGTISVTVGSNTATSLDTFYVTSDSGGVAPTITSFAPAIAAVGTSVTVSGAGFVTGAGPTSTGVNNALSVVTPASDAQLSFAVPPGATTGSVGVVTPYGSAQSTQPLLIIPQNVTAVSNVVATAILTVGGTQAINIPTANKYSVLAFHGTAGQWLSLQLSQYSSPGGGMLLSTLFDQSGATVSTATLYPSIMSMHIPQLPKTGWYMVMMQATNSVSFSITLEANPSFSTSNAIAVSTSVGGQSKRAIFTGAQQQFYAVGVTNIATQPVGAALTATIYDIAWHELPSNASSSTSFAVNANFKNIASESAVVVSAPFLDTFSSQLTLLQDPTAVVTIDAPPVSLGTSVPGQRAYLWFNATAGQSVSLALPTLTITPSAPIFLQLIKPDGKNNDVSNGGTNCNPPACHYALNNLPETGRYRVTIFPNQYALGGAMNFNALVSSDVTGPITINTPYSLNLSQPGQVARLTFSGTAGQHLGLYVSSVATTPSGGSLSMLISNSNGSNLVAGGISTSSSIFRNLPVLPQSDTYTIQVDPPNAATATAQITLVQNPTATVVNDSGPQNLSTTVADENAYFTFQGAAGQSLGLGIGSLSFNTAGGAAVVKVSKPDGNDWDGTGGINCQAPGCHYPLNGLTQTGTYTVTVTPPSGKTMSFSATLSTDVSGALTVGTPSAVTLSRAGQVGRFTFSGTTGERWAVNLGSIATTPSGANMSVLVYSPDGNALSGGSLQASSNASVNLSPLTQTGTYVVQVESQYAYAGSAQLTVVHDPTDTLTIDGVAVPENPPYPGQNVYLSFNATAGQNLSFAMASFSTTPSSQVVNYSIYKPNGAFLTSGFCSSAAGCHTALMNVSAGTYSITVLAPSSSSGMSFTASVSTDVAGALSPNTALSLNLARAGQQALLTFTASSKDSGGLYLANVATVPAGGAVFVTTFGPPPPGVQLSGGSGGVTTNGTVNLPILPASGTYTVLVEPPFADTATLQLTYLTPTALTVNGGTVTVPTTGVGQNTYFSFNGTATQNATFVLNSVVITPNGGNSNVSVYQPNGTRVNFTNCSTLTCTVPLTNLPVTDVYQVVVNAPTASTTMSYTAQVTSP